MVIVSVLFFLDCFQNTRLILPTAADSSRDMTASPFAGGAPAAANPVQDYNKLFKAEKDNLEFSEGLHNWVGNDVENRVLRKYGKLAPAY